MTKRSTNTTRRSTPTSNGSAIPAPEGTTPPPAHFKFDRGAALEAFHQASLKWQTASLRFVASATVVWFVGTSEARAVAQITSDIEATIKERGLKQAQSYRYLGLAKALFGALGKVSLEDPTSRAVLEAEAPEAAVEAILTWCAEAKITSVDKLGLALGVYARTPVGKAHRRKVKGKGLPAPEVVAQGRIAPTLAKMPPAAIASAVREAEADPVELVDAIAEKCNAGTLQEMISALQVRLAALTKSTPWRESLRAEEGGTRVHQ